MVVLQLEYILHPQGLVVVDEMIYVIGSVWDDDDLMQFSVHNFQNAQLLEEDCTVFDGFDVNTYIENGSFVFSKNKDTKLYIRPPSMTLEHLNLYDKYHAFMNAKKDLKAGDRLDGEGGFCARGRLVTSQKSKDEKILKKLKKQI